MNLNRVQACRRRSAVWAAFLTSLGDPGLDAISQDISLELRENGQHAGQRPDTRCRHIYVAWRRRA
jgi:hypothetical protein